MFIIFDIVVIAIIALCAFIGYKQGLIKSVIKILSFFIAIIVALVLYKPVSRIVINNTSIDDNIRNSMIEKTKIQNENNEENNKNETIQDMIQNKIIGTTENAIEEVADVFTIKVIEIGTLISLFLVIRILLIIVTLLTDVISKLPVLKQLNKTGGIIYGIVKGIFIVYTVLGVIYLITPLIGLTISESIDKSFVTSILYNNNLILNIFI